MKRAWLLALSIAVAVASAAAEPVKIRLGQGPASEEPLWLMKLKPELTPNQGKAYTLEFQVFRGTDMRFKAYEAGELDLFTGTASANLQAWSSGLKFKAVASLSRETEKGFVTQFAVLADSPIKSIRDLKGKVIGNTGARSSTELWLRLSLIKEGLDPDRDVSIVVVPFPTQGGALRAKKLDLAALVQPFYADELAKGGVRTLFTSKHSLPYDEELLNLLASEKFTSAHPEALRAFLKDFVAATKHYLANRDAIKKLFLESKTVRIPPEIYLAMQDYYFVPDGRIDIDAYRRTQDAMVAQGFQKTKIDPAQFIDLSFLPR
jgi:ABC-type nitrate/sulfonate/bicarbonate transport system substrate-binding protein